MAHVSCSLSLHGVLEPQDRGRFAALIQGSAWMEDSLDVARGATPWGRSLPPDDGFWGMIADHQAFDTGVLTLPMVVREEDLAHPDTDLVDALVAMGLAVCWSWRHNGVQAAGMDVWDPRDGKGQRFWLSSEGNLLVPIERLGSPHAMAHYRRFAALAQALPRVPFCTASTAHAVLAARARFPDDAFAPLHAPLP